MGIDLDRLDTPQPVREAAQRLADLRRRKGWLRDDDPEVRLATQQLMQLEHEYCTSLYYPWHDWAAIFAASIELGVIARVAPRPHPDFSTYGTDLPCGVEAMFDEQIPDAAKDEILDWLSQIPPVPGIASFKVQSNDLWIVTPEECRSALEALGDQPAPDFGDWDGWERWVRFISVAADHGGFQAT